MKISAAIITGAILLLLIVLLELTFGIRWSLRAFSLPDADLKPIRPVARFAFTGLFVTLTTLFSGAYLRAAVTRDS